MRIEMPFERFLELFRLVALGKLIQGLVHNLNGPLQNLGMDMELMEHSLRNDRQLPKEYSEGFLGRLKRMEGEFDQINRLIRSSSMRMDDESDFIESGNLKGLLEEEISFLHSNLYFKHNVRKSIELGEDLVRHEGLSRDLVSALCWFVQAVVEDAERGNAKVFGLSGRTKPSALEISLWLEGDMVGQAFRNTPQVSLLSEGSIKLEDGVGIAFPLSLLEFHGVLTACNRGQDRIEYTLTLPYPSPLHISDGQGVDLTG